MVPQVSPEISDALSDLNPNGFYAAFGGGVGSFGANFAFFYASGDCIWVDCGAGFGNQSLPGIQKTLPHRDLLTAAHPDAIILTHGHEDHIGALSYLGGFLKKDTPVYCSPYTSEIVKSKIKDAGISSGVLKFHLIDKNQSWQVAGFHLQNFFMPHSIPQTFSVGITHSSFKEKIYFTSDFKMDGREPRFNRKDIAGYGPVNYCFLDSTGSLSAGRAGDESELGPQLWELIKNWPGRVFVTTFASQIERIQHIIDSCTNTARPFGLLGYSLKNYLKAARASGEYDPGFQISNPSSSSRNAVWIIAGCQADPHSSFTRLSKGELGGFRIGEQDLIIYSASIIPGNEEPVFNALNRIAAAGAKVYGIQSGERQHVHRSGHGKQEEQRELLDLVEPDVVVPVHGDPLHFRSIAEHETFTGFDVRYAEGATFYRLDQDFKREQTLSPGALFVEETEIHQERRLYHTRNEIGKSGICTFTIDAENGSLVALGLIGVCSNEKQKSVTDELKQKAQKVIAKQPFPLSGTAEKKLRSKLQGLTRDFFGRACYVQLMLTES